MTRCSTLSAAVRISTGSARAARAQLAQHLQAVQARQAEVEDQEVEFVRREGGVGLDAAADLVDRVAGAAQRAQQAVGQHLVIFGDQDAHRRRPSGCWIEPGPAVLPTGHSSEWRELGSF